MYLLNFNIKGVKNIQEKSRQFLTLNTQNPGENLLSTQEDRWKKPRGKCELGNSLTKGSWQSYWEASVSFPDC